MELRPAKHAKKREEFDTGFSRCALHSIRPFFLSHRFAGNPVLWIERPRLTLTFTIFGHTRSSNEERLVCKIHILDNYPTCYIQWHIYLRPSGPRHLHSVALHLVHL